MSNTSFRYVDSEETVAALPFSDLIAGLRAGFAEGCVVPVRHHHHMEKHGEPDATLLLMPAWSNPDAVDQYLGVKLVTVVPGNTARGIPGLTSTYILYDATTGRQLAIMDGNVITGRRTVATSALGASFLAREDARSLLVLGAGRVASLIPQAYQAVRPIDTVAVWDINAETAGALVRNLQAGGLRAHVVSNLEEAAAAADIISAATLATDPLIQGNWLKKGTHVDLIGGFTPHMREADDETVRRSRVFVDTREALHEAGDLVHPIANGTVDKAHVRGTLADLVRGSVTGRTSDDEITYFKAVGSGLADLVAARIVYSVVR